jgi:dissimilatory sulfite reductase (desulfoviridin) alpha/beta subunit
LNCGACVAACPGGTLAVGRRGYRVQLGGRLGRRPALARELPCILSEDQVVEVARACLRIYKERCNGGKRFSHIFADADLTEIIRRFCPPAV